MTFQPKTPVWSAEDLASAGRLLYGEAWQSPLARALGVGLRTIQYMATGERPVHAGIARDVLDLLEARDSAVRALLDDLHAKLAAAQSP